LRVVAATPFQMFVFVRTAWQCMHAVCIRTVSRD
jgi:hypothetical protein